MNNTKLIKSAKLSVGIAEDSTIKDDEILMWINSAISDMERLNINVESNIDDEIIKGTIIMYVKANFGMLDIKEKEYARKSYIQNCNNLSLSSEYIKAEGVDKNV